MQRALSTSVGMLVVTCAMTVSAQPRTTLGPAKGPAATKGAATAKTTSSASAPQSGSRLLPGTTSNSLTTIQGNALDSTNGVLANYVVRLRDARFGRIVATTTTDKTGFFEFRNVDPGNYVVELVGRDQSILAASQILNIDAGQVLSAIVKLPFRIPPFAGLLGHTVASAAAVSSAAAASGLLAAEVTGTNASSNGKPTIR